MSKKTAFKIFDQLLLKGKQANGTKSYFNDVTGFNSSYNCLLLSNEPANFEYYNQFVQTTQIRKAVHVSDRTYNDGPVVESKSTGDIMRSSKPWSAEMMENYKIIT